MPSISPPRLQYLASGLPPAVLDKLKEALAAQDKHSQDVALSLNKALVVGDTVQVFAPYTSAVPLAVPSDWQQIVYQNSWVEFDGTTTGHYRKDATGRVEIQSRVKSGSAANAVVTTLPVGFRPFQRLLWATRAGGVYGTLEIDPNGNVFFPEAGSVSDTSICATFTCADASPYVPSCFPFDVLWPKPYAPTVVLAQCRDVSNAASPSSLAIGVPDSTMVVKGGRNLIHVRNIPGLLPSKSYSVTLVAW